MKHSGYLGGKGATSALTGTFTVRWKSVTKKPGNGYPSRMSVQTGIPKKRNRRLPIPSSARASTGGLAANYILRRLSGSQQKKQISGRKGTDSAALGIFR